MALKLVQSGDIYLLNLLLGSWGDLVMGIFVGDITPLATDSLGTYTAAEASWTGYARQVVTGWSSPSIDFSGHGVTTAPAVLFPNSSGSPVNAYGYFMMDPSQSSLLWVERDPSAPVTINDGQSYQIIPQFTLITEF